MLDGLTWRRMSCCPSSGAQTSGDAANWHSKGDYRQSWWGGFFKTGMTTLTIEGVNDFRLDFYLNGVFNTFQAATPAGFTKNITLSGYTDGAAVLLEIRTNGNPTTDPAGITPLYRIDDCYLSPIVVTSSYPGVPTFSGTYDATRFNQLRDAIQYVWDVVTAVPIAPLTGSIFAQSSHKMETIRLFDGSVGRYQTTEVLRVGGTLICRTNAEHFEVYVGGVLAYTSPTYTAGQNVTIWQPIALTNTVGTRTSVAIRAVNEDNTYGPAPGVFSSYSLVTLRSETGSAYPVQTIPGLFTADESISAATLNTRLTAISTMVSGAFTRLGARPEVWNRARMSRRVFAKDDTQVTRNFKKHAATFVRQGDRLVVRGKGVKIGYGAISFKPPVKENDPINYNDFTFANEVSVGPGEDVVASSEIMLDTIPGLLPGVRYFVFGPVVECALEYLT